jgi:hypothetical protein
MEIVEDFMGNSKKQIKIFGSNNGKDALFSPNSKDIYICANSSITRGICAAPDSFQQCFERFESVQQIAQTLGFITGKTGGNCGGVQYSYGAVNGSCGACGGDGGGGEKSVEVDFRPLDLYLDQSSAECGEIYNDPEFGPSWLGCLWGTPSVPFSCTCPKIGPNFYKYLKLRLNVATFWNTPKNTPVKRAEFLDALKYSKKANITVPGDFSLKIGQVVLLKVDNSSGFPYNSSTSALNGIYYIIGIKHVINNSGTHETALELTTLS